MHYDMDYASLALFKQRQRELIQEAEQSRLSNQTVENNRREKRERDARQDNKITR